MIESTSMLKFEVTESHSGVSHKTKTAVAVDKLDVFILVATWRSID